MDDGQGAPPAGPEDDGALSMPMSQPWDDDLPFRRDEFVRVISSCLKGLGYGNASTALEKESGVRAEADNCTARMLSCVSSGRWKEALDLLSCVQFSKPSLHKQARALLLRHRLVELVEDRRLDEALTCLREDLAPLFTGCAGDGGGGDGSGDGGGGFGEPEQLHALSTLLLAPTAASLRRLSSPSGRPWLSRAAARSNATVALQGLLAEAGRAIRPGRLENLVAQAVTLQTMECVYHNTPDDKLPLTTDHSCELHMLPHVSTHVLEDHADEVWCCRFSNGGTMLATSSADGVLNLWDIGGGGGGGYGNGGRQGRAAPSLHKRIQVRDGAPQAIAWSPDDRWLLTCGESSEVTRWDVTTGAESRCYGGEHTEAVTGVAWLRDGRGFVSAGLDRKVVVWSLGGIVLSCWNCNTRITGIVVAPPTQPPLTRAPLPLPLYEDTAAASAAAARAIGASASTAGEQHWSNEHWPLEAAGAVALCPHNNGMMGNGRGAGRFASPRGQQPPPPPPPPLYRRHGNSTNKEPRQQRWQRGQKTSSRGLRRCRAWIICRQDTIQALDIEVTDYGEPPPPPPAAEHGGGMNGASSGGARGFQNGSSSGRHAEVDIKVEERREDEGGGGGRRGRNRHGLGLGGGGGGVSPRFTPRRKTGGSCSIDESVHQYFEGDIISSVSAAADGSNDLLLHMDRARICSWSSRTRSVVKKYEGHHQDRYMVQSAFGGLNDGFVASGSEDSLVYLWHRKSGELIASIPGHAGTVNAVHWNPTRPGMLASVSDDQTVRIWEPSPQPPPPPPQLPVPARPLGDSCNTPAGAAAGASVVAGSAADGSGGGGGGGGGPGSRRFGDPPSPRSRGGGDRSLRRAGAGRVRIKTELGATEEGSETGAERGDGSSSGSRGRSKGKGKTRGRSDGGGVKEVEVEEGWEGRRRRWGYGLGQGWEEDGGDGHYDGGFSARIAALRW